MLFFSYFSAESLSNSYIISADMGEEAIIIDPGIFDEELLAIIEQNKLYLKHILITHSHDSHIGGIKTILKIYDAQIYSYRQSIMNFAATKIRNTDKIELGSCLFEVLETPGHSGDSLTYKIDNLIFTGDTLLAGAIGHTVDAFSRGLIIASLKEKVFNLPDNTFIFPGHGPPSKVGIERYLNLDINEEFLRVDDFFQRLKKSVIIADGAVGTMVQQSARVPLECVEAVNLLQPELLTEIHRQYVLAGSEILKTNTFGANRYILEKFQLQEKTKEINRQGVLLAKGAAGPGSFVAGSVGPFIPAMDELVLWQADNLDFVIREQIETLLSEGIDILLLETFSNPEHLLYTLDLVKKLTSIPVIASLATGRTGTTYDGRDILPAAQALKEAGADVIGINCGYGISAVGSTLLKLAGLDIPVSVMPNAGLPQRLGARLMYGVSEDYFAANAVTFAEAGARIIGGCCGTTPAHIKAAAVLLKEKNIVRKAGMKREILQTAGSPERKPGALLEKFASVALPVICEIDPPAGLDTARELEAIKQVVCAGADAVSMAENPLATVKISNLAFAAYVRRQVDIDIILHLTGRDRNLLGLESAMLGAHLLGIRGLLLVTGDPSHERRGAANVYDTDSIGLIRMAAGINRGTKLGGKAAGLAADFSIGAAVNPNMQDFSMQLKKLERKAEAGAVFAMTQPLYAAEHVRRFLDAARYLALKIYPGIFPVLSLRTAAYLHNEVPGISIPQALRDELARYPDKEDQKKIGLAHAQNLILELKRQVAGFYLIAPHGNPGILADLVTLVKQ